MSVDQEQQKSTEEMFHVELFFSCSTWNIFDRASSSVPRGTLSTGRELLDGTPQRSHQRVARLLEASEKMKRALEERLRCA